MTFKPRQRLRVRLRYYAEGAAALAALVPMFYGILIVAQVMP